MNKLIGVSLTLLIGVSLASAVVIESPAAHMDLSDILSREMTTEGFVSGAIVDVPNSGSVRHKTATLAASDDEIKTIAAMLDSRDY